MQTHISVEQKEQSAVLQTGDLITSQKGVVLIVVLVVSAVALVMLTTLIYLVKTGTQVSGLQKRYMTALEAAFAGNEIFYQLIGTRAESGNQANLASDLNAFNITMSTTTPAACTGSLMSGATYTALAAKLMTPSSSWVYCDKSVAIDPSDASTYDMKTQIGTGVAYDVYAKIVATTDGNTGGDSGLLTKGVVSAGEVSVSPRSYHYAIEVHAENSARTGERAKLSVLYQY